MYNPYPVHMINENNYAAGSADRAQLMKNAWRIARHYGFSIGAALRTEWRKYREAQPEYELWGCNIGAKKPELVRGKMTLAQAKELEYCFKYSYHMTVIHRSGDPVPYPLNAY